MDGRRHVYSLTVTWTGNTGTGTTSHAGYDRAFTVAGANKPIIAGSSDPAFRGDDARWNPEELLLASLSSCHKLWFLALCAEAGIVVVAYVDTPTGEMIEEAGGAGRFASVTLRPRATLAGGSDGAKANALHETAHAMCFIARSVNFPVTVVPTVAIEGSTNAGAPPI